MRIQNGKAQPRVGWRAAMYGAAAAMLLAPAVAMQFTREMNWGPGDFAIFGAMLLAVCAAFELTARAAQRPLHRAVVGFAILATFLLVWADLAVGIW